MTDEAPLTAPAKPPRLSSQQARMLLSISTHGDALAHCRTSSDHGGADGTLTSLHRHKLVTYVREARKGSPSTLVLTDLGRLALADHQRRTGGATLALSPAAPARGRRRGRAAPQVTDSAARDTAERVVRRYLRACGGDRAGFDYGDRERDLTAWITAELVKAGRR